MNNDQTTPHGDDPALVAIAAGELTPLMIDWLIARDEGIPVAFDGTYIRHTPEPYEFGAIYSPSSDPGVGHALLEREKIQSRYIDSPGHPWDGRWLAQDCRFQATSRSVVWLDYGRSYAELELGFLTGPTMLIAGLRFIIAKSRVGKSKAPMVRVPVTLVAGNCTTSGGAPAPQSVISQ